MFATRRSCVERTLVKEICSRTGGCQAAICYSHRQGICSFVHLFVLDPMECGSLLVRSFIRTIFISFFVGWVNSREECKKFSRAEADASVVGTRGRTT